jgi:hypothetical protein
LVATPRFGARVDIGGKSFDAVIVARETRQGRFLYDMDRDRGAGLVRRGEEVGILKYALRNPAPVEMREYLGMVARKPQLNTSIGTARTTEKNVRQAA